MGIFGPDPSRPIEALNGILPAVLLHDLAPVGPGKPIHYIAHLIGSFRPYLCSRTAFTKPVPASTLGKVSLRYSFACFTYWRHGRVRLEPLYAVRDES